MKQIRISPKQFREIEKLECFESTLMYDNIDDFDHLKNNEIDFFIFFENGNLEYILKGWAPCIGYHYTGISFVLLCEISDYKIEEK